VCQFAFTEAGLLESSGEKKIETNRATGLPDYKEIEIRSL
jgi:hypothetical protein